MRVNNPVRQRKINPMNVRMATIEDSNFVLKLSRQLAPAFIIDAKSFGDSYSELLADPAVYLRVAEIEGVIVAYLLGWSHRAFFANGAVAWV